MRLTYCCCSLVRLVSAIRRVTPEENENDAEKKKKTEKKVVKNRRKKNRNERSKKKKRNELGAHMRTRATIAEQQTQYSIERSADLMRHGRPGGGRRSSSSRDKQTEKRE